MRTLLTILALLAACSPPAEDTAATSDVQVEDPNSPRAANPDAALLNAAPVAGQWFYQADAQVFSAGFAVPDSEFQFVVSCTQPSGKVTVMSDHELYPDQDTTLSLIVDDNTVNLPARSFNEGLAHVAAQLEGGTEPARAVAVNLGDAQTRFGARVGDDVRVYPWSEELTRALEQCR